MEIKLTAAPGSMAKNKTGGWRTYKPKIDMPKCIGCGLCSKVCPEGIIGMVDSKFTNKKKEPRVDFDFCKGCGICSEECPVKAIEMILDSK